jgi:hypothetical protein
MAEGPPSAWRLPDLVVDVEGTWLDDGVEVTHPGVLANLRANLRRDAQGYFIQTRVRIPVRVADVPWVVTRVEPHGDRLRAILNDGTEESVDPATLRLGPGEVPYCAVKEGRFEARFSRAAAHQLLGLVEPDAAGAPVLRLGDRRWVLPRAS